MLSSWLGPAPEWQNMLRPHEAGQKEGLWTKQECPAIYIAHPGLELAIEVSGKQYFSGVLFFLGYQDYI